MKIFLLLVFLLVAGLTALGCEDDVFLCESPDSCVTQEQCFEECGRVCIDGDFNLASFECTFEGTCFCECFVGCFVE